MAAAVATILKDICRYPGCKSYLILVDASTKTILARNYSFRPQTLIKPQIMREALRKGLREALREAHPPSPLPISLPLPY